jgi:hypothetical protein
MVISHIERRESRTMEQEYYDRIREEIEKLTQHVRQREEMDIVCAGNGKTYRTTKNAILKNIRTNGKYLSRSYVQSFKIVTDEQKKTISDKLTGRKLSDETRAKMSVASKGRDSAKNLVGNRYFDLGLPSPLLGTTRSEEAIEQQREKISGRVYSDEHRQHMSEGKKKMYAEQGGMSEETKFKISQTTAENIKSGKFNPYKGVRTYLHVSPKCTNSYNQIRLRSSYEKKACELMDLDETILHYAYEQIDVIYLDAKGERKIYIPDFFVGRIDGTYAIIEVKPKGLMERVEENQIKQAAVIKFCEEKGMSYEHWGEDRLGIEVGTILPLKDELYQTYEEASLVAQSLGIKSGLQYKKRYKEDPKLPSNPDVVYPNWDGWERFLTGQKTVRYTLQEAMIKVKEMGIGTSKEYFQRYKEDPRLHCAPDEFYKGEWKNWYHFLGMYNDVEASNETVD